MAELAPGKTFYGAEVWPRGVVYHDRSVCEGRDLPCLFHSPSQHHMLSWPINIRLDRFAALSERLCPHGIGHPDPDSLAYVETLHKPSERGYEGIHGCDGCCGEPDAGAAGAVR
jgi:hypothetical protein